MSQISRRQISGQIDFGRRADSSRANWHHFSICSLGSCRRTRCQRQGPFGANRVWGNGAGGFECFFLNPEVDCVVVL
jgi:hypothetical protein